MQLRKITKKNKKANLTVMVSLAVIFAVAMAVGLMVVLGSGIATYTLTTINEVTSDLGVVDTGGAGANLSHYSDISIGAVNDSVQMLKFFSGIILIFGILGILMFAASIRLNPNLALIGFYLLLVLCVLMMSLFMSNIYEDFLNDTGDIATELQSMTMASFILLYMPHIFTVIAFVGGIIIFSGTGGEF